MQRGGATALDPSPARRRGLRSAGITNVVVMFAGVILFAALLLTAPQTAPPAIAEIAPQAVAQITQPPPEQATQFGKQEGAGTAQGDGSGGEGAGGAGGPGTKTTTQPP